MQFLLIDIGGAAELDLLMDAIETQEMSLCFC